MDSLYSREISVFLHSLPWPDELDFVVTEEETHLQFILFRDNFSSFDGVDQMHIAGLVKQFMEKVRGMGVPIYMQVEKGGARRG